MPNSEDVFRLSRRENSLYSFKPLRHGRLSANGDPNPSAMMAGLNGVALNTAQGWIAKARSRGLLPPGPRGRPGEP